MPFEPGHKKSAGPKKEKPWRDALLVALKDKQLGDGQALRKIAEKCVEAALDGDKDARKEIADRLDGKPVQATELTGEGGGPVQMRAVLNVTIGPKSAPVAKAGARVSKPSD